jgi:hypothetical protein
MGESLGNYFWHARPTDIEGENHTPKRDATPSLANQHSLADRRAAPRSNEESPRAIGRRGCGGLATGEWLRTRQRWLPIDEKYRLRCGGSWKPYDPAASGLASRQKWEREALSTQKKTQSYSDNISSRHLNVPPGPRARHCGEENLPRGPVPASPYAQTH